MWIFFCFIQVLSTIDSAMLLHGILWTDLFLCQVLTNIVAIIRFFFGTQSNLLESLFQSLDSLRLSTPWHGSSKIFLLLA
jgi:hypothetical protein